MEPQEIDSALDELENRLDRLRSLYEQYFMGIEKIEPTVPRKDVDRRFWILRRTQIRNTARRFRLQTLVQRYNTFQQHWTRICREIENGTYVRHLLKARKNLGAEPKTWAAKKRLGLLRRDKQGTSEAPPADGAAAGANGSVPAPPSAYPSSPPASPAPSEPPARPSVFVRPSRQAELTPLDLEFDEAPTLPPRAAEPRSSVPRPPPTKLTVPAATKPQVPAATKPPIPAPAVAAASKPPVPASTVPVKPSGLPLPRPGLPARPPGAATVKPPLPSAAAPKPATTMQPRPAAIPQTPAATAKPAGPNGPPAPPAPRPPTAAPQPPVARPPMPAQAPAARPLAAAEPVAPRPPIAASAVARPPTAAPVAPERPAPAARPAAAPAPRPVAAAPVPAPKPAGNSGLSDERVRQLHQELAAARKQLNQSSNLSVDSLAKSLRDTENKLRTQHGGRSVDFQVVIKDGKPIVKPVVRR